MNHSQDENNLSSGGILTYRGSPTRPYQGAGEWHVQGGITLATLERNEDFSEPFRAIELRIDSPAPLMQLFIPEHFTLQDVTFGLHQMLKFVEAYPELLDKLHDYVEHQKAFFLGLSDSSPNDEEVFLYPE